MEHVLVLYSIGNCGCHLEKIINFILPKFVNLDYRQKITNEAKIAQYRWGYYINCFIWKRLILNELNGDLFLSNSDQFFPKREAANLRQIGASKRSAAKETKAKVIIVKQINQELIKYCRPRDCGYKRRHMIEKVENTFFSSNL
jgi:hypothetical protein